MRIAILDDEPSQLDLMSHSAQSIGHQCQVFERGEALQRALRRESFDLVVVDWQLPDIDGPDMVRWIRAHLSDPVPVLFVTNRGEERDIVEGLQSGADDYMVKPLRVREFMARMSALLRRSYPGQVRPQVTQGDFALDAAARTVAYQGQAIELKAKEFDLAWCLFMHVGRLLSRQHLQEAVWGRASDVSSRTLDTHVSALRTKLGLRPARGLRLTAVYGLGYRLEAVDEALAPGNEPAAVERVA